MTSISHSDDLPRDKTSITLPVLEFTGPGPVLALRTTPLPAQWLRALREQWYANPAHRDRNLPTHSLIEMVAALDPNIIAVARDLDDRRWICAHADVDSDVIRIAIAAWAAIAVTPRQPELDWELLLQEQPLGWDDDIIPLVEWDTHPNGTAKVAPHTFQLLPSYLAGLVVDHGLHIRGVHRRFVLDPVDSSGERSAISWPPEAMPDRATGDALWSYKITFQMETVPLYPRPRIHAELSTVRFAYQPVRYVPGKPKRATLWIHASQGFLRARERPTLLAATTVRRHVNGQWRWAWEAALSRALGRLTTRTYPDPEAVLADPAAHKDTSIAAFTVYRTGMKLARPQPSAPVKHGDDAKKSKTVLHATGVGFQPVDHMAVYEQLIPLLAPIGLEAVDLLGKSTRRAVSRRLPRTQPTDQTYHLELWTQPGDTHQAILTALTHPTGLNLTAVNNPNPNILRFTGDYTLDVTTHPVGELAAGLAVPQPSDEDPASETTLSDAARDRIAAITAALPTRCDHPAAVVELDGPDMFARINRGDPKPAIKTGYAQAGRLPQCLRPIHAQPPSADDEDKPDTTLAEGTPYRKGDLKRAAAAVLDSLRQAGRSAVLPEPPGVDGPCELSGVWLERHAGLWVPILVQVTTTGEIRAQLVGTGNIPYTDLPAALVSGEGRLDKDFATSRRQLTEFLTDAINPRATHDRALMIRSANLRTRGWAWLQDQHITPNQLLLPGVDPSRTTDNALKPGDLPGLRIIRLRERSTGNEVPRAFVTYWEENLNDDHSETIDLVQRFARTSGLFPFTRWVYYGIAPRSDQAQTPISLTKFDREQPRNARWAGWNPNPLEIMPAFLQDHDEPEDWASYTHLLRRAHLHTTIATQMPLPLHLASLADEYLL